MITYIGCDAARDMLDTFVDGELPVTDQVALESHLRWCRACAARVEDLRLIGVAIRCGVPAVSSTADDTQALSAIQSGVLMRIRTEREQALRARVRELFTDMRLFWPALGATAAVLICLGGAFSVLQQLASDEQPDSLAAMIESMANPGSDQNPLRLDDRISIPRMIDESMILEGIPQDDAVFAVATVVTREGRIANYELLESERPHREAHENAAHETRVAAMLDAVKQTRFAPAQTGGRPVAVNMVWLILRTTASGDAQLEQLLKAEPRPRTFALPPVTRSGQESRKGGVVGSATA